MNKGAIGIFDSGVGGLTVFSAIRKELPREDLIYLGDIKNFPYGEKSRELIIELAKKNVDFLCRKNVKLIVIACGTATSQAISILQELYRIPIIGIISPTVDYLSLQNNVKKIGIIATTGTIKSKQWENDIKLNNKNIEIISKACPILAPIAEEGWIDNDIAKLVIKEYLKDFKNIEKLILGCTHYPLFSNLIQKELGNNVELINTGEQLAKYLKKYLKDNKLETNNKVGSNKIFVTDKNEKFSNLLKKILKQKTAYIFLVK